MRMWAAAAGLWFDHLFSEEREREGMRSEEGGRQEGGDSLLWFITTHF